MRAAVRAENLSKEYRIGTRSHPAHHNLTEALVGGAKRAWGRLAGGPARSNEADGTLWALKDVSFEVGPGELIGLIGCNGAGKSTLLKILSQIVEPSDGRAEVRGRLGSLLEVGTGFHPELTGRENVYLNGSILGMTRREIDRKFDEIVAFAEVERFLDMPVKRFSSGMYVRLAFAVAAHLHPDVLIVDEVLAVGDQAFQKKCLQTIRSAGGRGRTVLFVSHNMSAIQNVCARCIYLKAGKVAADGPTDEVIQRYNKDLVTGVTGSSDLTRHPGRTPKSIPTMEWVTVADDADPAAEFILMGGTARVAVDFNAPEPLDNITFGLVVKDTYQNPLFGVNNMAIPGGQPSHPTSSGRITCRLPNLPLMPGKYPIDLYFGTNGHNFDVVLGATALQVFPSDIFSSGKLPPEHCGSIWWPAAWELTSRD